MSTQAQTDSEPRPVDGSAYPELDRFQRIEVLDVIDGFFPTTKAEQVEVMGLHSVIDRPGGAAKHLAEVSRGRQHGVDTDDPARAARKIVHQYAEWAYDAYQSHTDLNVLKDELTDTNPELRMDRVVDPSDPQYFQLLRGSLRFLRYFDLALLRKTGEVDAVGYDPQRIDYSTGNPGIMHYMGLALESWYVRQVTRRLPDAINHESNRLQFWIPRLVEVTKYSPKNLKAIAYKGLDTVKDRSPDEVK